MTIGNEGIQPPAETPAATPKVNTFQRIIGALFSPNETFADIALRPNILAPLLIFIILGFITAMLCLPKIDFETGMRDQMEAGNPNMSEGDVDRMVKVSAAFAKGMFYASPVVTIIAFAVISGVLLLAFKIFGGEGNYKQAFSTTLYAWTPIMIKSLATTAIILTRGTVDLLEMETVLRSSPGFLVDRKDSPVMFALLSSLDIFTIWSLALFSIGFSYVAKFTKAKAATIVVAIWAALTLLKVGGAAVGAMSQARRS